MIRTFIILYIKIHPLSKLYYDQIFFTILNYLLKKEDSKQPKLGYNHHAQIDEWTHNMLSSAVHVDNSLMPKSSQWIHVILVTWINGHILDN